MKRQAESHVNERLEDTTIIHEFEAAAHQHQRALDKLTTKLDELDSEAAYLDNKFNQIKRSFRNGWVYPPYYTKLDYDFAVQNNNDLRREVATSRKELEREYDHTNAVMQWNLDQVDIILNELYGYEGAPVFMGPGVLDDDEAKPDEVFNVNGQIVDSMDAYNRYHGYHHPIGPLTHDQYQGQFYANTNNTVARNLNATNQVPYTVDWY